MSDGDVSRVLNSTPPLPPISTSSRGRQSPDGGYQYKVLFYTGKNLLPYLGLHNAHHLLALKISRKKLVCVYNAHGLLKKIVVRNVRIKYQSYIFFSPLSMFHLLGEFKNHLSLFIFNKVAKY